MLSIGTAASASAATYEVKSGDTLWGISKDNNTTVDHLKELNNLSTNLIFPQQQLTVTPEQDSYVVKKGDTLYAISIANNMSLDELMSMNHLTSDIIQPNQKLVLVAGATAQAAQPAKVQEASESATPAPAPVAKKAPTPQPMSAQTTEKTLTVRATAYTADCNGCSGITKTGVNLKANPDAKVIAVDPTVIPLGSKVYVQGYGYATAADIGGGIKGNHIDLFIPSKEAALEYGSRTVTVTVLN